MAGRIAYYGNIVRDGLVLNLDAAKQDSYPGSGTVWRDIANGVITGSLINGPTFNPSNFGSIVFDGVDDYVTLGNINLIQNDFTLNIWFTLNTTSSKEHFIFSNRYATAPSLLIAADSSISGILLSAYYSTAGGVIQYGLNSATLANSQIYNLTLIRSGSVNTPYINGITQTSRIFTESTVLGLGRYELGWATIRNKITAYMQGNIYSTQIYNRALSASEITQNYNAQKGRYGL
jgi:hypothetical protein